MNTSAAAAFASEADATDECRQRVEGALHRQGFVERETDDLKALAGFYCGQRRRGHAHARQLQRNRAAQLFGNVGDDLGRTEPGQFGQHLLDHAIAGIRRRRDAPGRNVRIGQG